MVIFDEEDDLLADDQQVAAPAAPPAGPAAPPAGPAAPPGGPAAPPGGLAAPPGGPAAPPAGPAAPPGGPAAPPGGSAAPPGGPAALPPATSPAGPAKPKAPSPKKRAAPKRAAAKNAAKNPSVKKEQKSAAPKSAAKGGGSKTPAGRVKGKAKSAPKGKTPAMADADVMQDVVDAALVAVDSTLGAAESTKTGGGGKTGKAPKATAGKPKAKALGTAAKAKKAPKAKSGKTRKTGHKSLPSSSSDLDDAFESEIVAAKTPGGKRTPAMKKATSTAAPTTKKKKSAASEQTSPSEKTSSKTPSPSKMELALTITDSSSALAAIQPELKAGLSVNHALAKFTNAKGIKQKKQIKAKLALVTPGAVMPWQDEFDPEQNLNEQRLKKALAPSVDMRGVGKIMQEAGHRAKPPSPFELWLEDNSENHFAGKTFADVLREKKEAKQAEEELATGKSKETVGKKGAMKKKGAGAKRGKKNEKMEEEIVLAETEDAGFDDIMSSTMQGMLEDHSVYDGFRFASDDPEEVWRNEIDDDTKNEYREKAKAQKTDWEKK